MKANRMTCKQARPRIALWVGNDLDELSRYDLERHLAECPDCRAYRDSLQRTVGLLESASQESEPSPPEDSLWPDVACRIIGLQAQRPPMSSSPWRPLIAIAAVCLVVAFISIRYPGTRYEVPEPAQPMPFAPAADQPSPRPLIAPEEEPVIVVEPQQEQARYGWPASTELKHSRSRVPVMPVSEW